jgi:hypothetical protein
LLFGLFGLPTTLPGAHFESPSLSFTLALTRATLRFVRFTDEKKLKEVKNARLAMVAFLGFASQAAVRGMGPIECLKLHLEDPGHNNIFTSAVGPEATVACMVLGITPVILEAKKALGDDDETFRPIPW